MKIELEKVWLETPVGDVSVPFIVEQIPADKPIRQSKGVDILLITFDLGLDLFHRKSTRVSIECGYVVHTDGKLLEQQLEERIAKNPELVSYYGEFTLKEIYIGAKYMQARYSIAEDNGEFTRFARGKLYGLHDHTKCEWEKKYSAILPIEQPVCW